jgi:hypothetical protein
MNPQEAQQPLILGYEQKVHKWVSENLDDSEEYSIELETRVMWSLKHTGIRVTIRSIRAEELLLRLYQDVFSMAFREPSLFRDEHGVWSAWFGYSEGPTALTQVSM